MSNFECPLPHQVTDNVLLAHGEGSGMTRQMIRERILPAFSNPVLEQLEDAARFTAGDFSLVMTTDSYVVSPLFFPGGDIGSLAVYGTVNDLLVSGGEPVCLTLGMILEEGLPFEILDQILASAQRAAKKCGVMIIAGDTKVVPRGDCDQLYLNTSGVGLALPERKWSSRAIQPGDELIVTGQIAQHGVAILTCREQLDFSPAPQSDSRCVREEIEALTANQANVRAIRDATRGGIAAVLQEWAEASGCTLTIEAQQIPVSREVSAVCELLGLDPVHIACEGTLMIAVGSGTSASIVNSLHAAGFPYAARVGQARARDLFPVTRINLMGLEQPLEEPLGAPLPRIC